VTDPKGRLNDRVAREALRDRFKIRDFAGAGGGPFRFSSFGQVGARAPRFYADKRQNGRARMLLPLAV
jgi:hypothetical protein